MKIENICAQPLTELPEFLGMINIHGNKLFLCKDPSGFCWTMGNEILGYVEQTPNEMVDWINETANISKIEYHSFETIGELFNWINS